MLGMRVDSGSRTFLLGVGCQKGGTAWLHRYLADSRQCDPGFQKEYHVWDTLDLDSAAHFRARLGRRTERAGRRIGRGAPADAISLRLASFHADPEAYYDYFELLLSRDAITLTSDITPSYALLPAERLAGIRAGFAARGIRVAPVFLMREPAERIWSAVRMYRERQLATSDVPSEEHVLEVYAQPLFECRTRYETTLTTLEKVFDRDEIFYGLYEELFEGSTLARLCDFLGIEHHEPQVDRRVNASPKAESAQLPESTARLVAQHYRATYEAVTERIGADVVARAWPDHRLLG
jgi:hypothetical protein